MISAESIKVWAEIAQATLTSLGIILGGLWTYFRFVHGRLGMPKAELQNAFAILAYNDEKFWLHNEVTVLNRGDVRIPIRRGFCRVRECLQSSDLESQLSLSSDPKNDSPHHCAIDWPQLDKKTWSCTPKEGGEIEPGEVELFHYDFLIPKTARLLHVESFFENSSKKNGIGWRCVTIIDVQKWISAENGLENSTKGDPQKATVNRRMRGAN